MTVPLPTPVRGLRPRRPAVRFATERLGAFVPSVTRISRFGLGDWTGEGTGVVVGGRTGRNGGARVERTRPP